MTSMPNTSGTKSRFRRSTTYCAPVRDSSEKRLPKPEMRKNSGIIQTSANVVNTVSPKLG